MKQILGYIYQCSPLQVVAYFAAISAATFFLFWLDKRLAMKGGCARTCYRIPESSLLMVSLMGGSVAAWFAMNMFRHKTSKPSFRMRFWAVVAAQMAMIGYLWYIGFLSAWLVPYENSEQPVEQPSQDAWPQTESPAKAGVQSE